MPKGYEVSTERLKELRDRYAVQDNLRIYAPQEVWRTGRDLKLLLDELMEYREARVAESLHPLMVVKKGEGASAHLLKQHITSGPEQEIRVHNIAQPESDNVPFVPGVLGDLLLDTSGDVMKRNDPVAKEREMWGN